MKKNQYPVKLFKAAIVFQDANGNFVLKKDSRISFWRTGKHTKGHFSGVGQLFTTENDLVAAVLDFDDLKFSKRHEYNPVARFLDIKIDPF